MFTTGFYSLAVKKEFHCEVHFLYQWLLKGIAYYNSFIHNKVGIYMCQMKPFAYCLFVWQISVVHSSIMFWRDVDTASFIMEHSLNSHNTSYISEIIETLISDAINTRERGREMHTASAHTHAQGNANIYLNVGLNKKR